MGGGCPAEDMRRASVEGVSIAHTTVAIVCGLEMPHVFVEPGQHLAGVVGAQRGRPQDRADLTHRLRRREAVPDHISDHQADRARGQGEHVVPVTPDLAVAAGDIAGGELQPVNLR